MKRYFYRGRHFRRTRLLWLVALVAAAIMGFGCTGEGIPASDPEPYPTPPATPAVAPRVTPDPGVRPSAVAVP